jgi:hypothetical protein
MYTIRPLLALVAIAFLGCDLADVRTGSAEVKPNEEVYRIGHDELILIRVSNTSDVILFYDACRWPKVDVYVDDQFVRTLGFAECRAIIPTSLAPGETLSFEVSLRVFVEMAEVTHRDKNVRYVTDFALYRDRDLRNPLPEKRYNRGQFQIVWNPE